MEIFLGWIIIGVMLIFMAILAKRVLCYWLGSGRAYDTNREEIIKKIDKFEPIIMMGREEKMEYFPKEVEMFKKKWGFHPLVEWHERG